MAKASTSAKASNKTSHKKTLAAFPSRSEVIEATFALIAEKGLAKLRLSTLAKTFGLSLAEFRNEYPSVETILTDFIDQVDAEMLDNVSNDGDMSKRDLYFDMLMSRFDSLQVHRDGVVRWLNELPKCPPSNLRSEKRR